MNAEAELLFRGKKPRPERLLAYGFARREGSFVLQKEVLEGQFRLCLQVDAADRLT